MSEILSEGVGQRLSHPLKKDKKRFVVKKGAFAIKVYPTPPGWTVTWVSPEGRKRKWFSTETKAREFSGTIGDQMTQGLTKPVSTEKIASIQRLEEMVAPHGVTLEFVVSQWTEWKSNGVNVDEALRDFKRRQAAKSVLAADAVAEFLTAKRQDKVGDRQIENLESRLGRFAAENPGSLDKLTPEHLDNWLRELRKVKKIGDKIQLKGPVSLQTRNHYRAALTNLLHFASKPGRRWLSFPASEFEDNFEPAKVERGEIEIFTPEQVTEMFNKAPKELLASLIFAFFSGLRPSEIQRLQWKDVNLEEGHVFVRGKTRTARYRVAHLPANAIAWLSRVDRRQTVCGYWHPGDAASDLAGRLNIRWIHDGPRHSFVSYRLAELRDMAKVSEETGTSAETLRKHYRKPIPASEATKYFAIYPPGHQTKDKPTAPATATLK
jgi:integrase